MRNFGEDFSEDDYTPARVPAPEPTPAPVIEAAPEPDPVELLRQQLADDTAALQAAGMAPVAPLAPPETGIKESHRQKLKPREDLRARFVGHSAFNNMVREDWQRAINDDPFSFDAMLFMPEIAQPPVSQAAHFDTPEFSEINNNQRELVYADPVVVTLLDCPDERDHFTATDSDTANDGNVDDFMVVRSSSTGIPIGSVFAWYEEVAEDTSVERWWYVLKIFSYGTAKVGSLYFCVPAHNFSGEGHKKVDRDE